MTAVLALAAVAIPFVITPGASFTLTVAHAHRTGPPAWRQVTLGTSAGLLVIALAVGTTGLGTFLTSTPALRMGVGLMGAAVLIAYSITICARVFREGRGQTDTPTSAVARLARWSFLIAATNPKALALYVLIVPTLAGPELGGLALSMAFAAIHMCLQTAWLCLIHHLAVRIPSLTRSPRARHRLLAMSGILMLCLGFLTATHSLTVVHA